MTLPIDDCAKRRLTEPRQIEHAARFMLARGIAVEDLPRLLARFYYVDMDALNAVLPTLHAAAATDKTTETERCVA
jgi:hypothetical protein